MLFIVQCRHFICSSKEIVWQLSVLVQTEFTNYNSLGISIPLLVALPKKLSVFASAKYLAATTDMQVLV